jgi:hypothetical protein
MAIDYKSVLLNMLGLPENTDDAALSNSVQTFQNELVSYKEATDSDLVRLQNSEAALQSENAKLANSVTQLTNSNKSMLETLVNSDLAQYKDVIGNAEGVKEMLMNNREVGLKFLSGLKVTNAAPAPVVAPVAAQPTRKAPLHNSSKASQPEPILNANNGIETEEFSVKIANRAREIQATNKGMGWNQAFLNARSEIQAGLQIAN